MRLTRTTQLPSRLYAVSLVDPLSLRIQVDNGDRRKEAEIPKSVAAGDAQLKMPVCGWERATQVQPTNISTGLTSMSRCT